MRHLLDQITNTLHLPKLIPPQQINMHINPLLRIAQLPINPPNIQKRLHIAVPQHRREALAQGRDARDAAAHLEVRLHPAREGK